MPVRAWMARSRSTRSGSSVNVQRFFTGLYPEPHLEERLRARGAAAATGAGSAFDAGCCGGEGARDDDGTAPPGRLLGLAARLRAHPLLGAAALRVNS